MFCAIYKRLSVNSLVRGNIKACPFEFTRRFLTSQVTSSEAEEYKDLHALTKHQKQQYERHGYVVVPDVFSKEHVEEMKKELDGYVECSRKLQKTDDLFVLDPQHTPDEPILLRLRCISNHSKLFHETMCDPKLVEIASDLIGPSVRYVNQEKVNLKPPQSSSSLIRWHQDWAFFPYTNDSLVTVCIAIDDSNRENGCLQVVPGSHKGPLYSHFQDGAFISAITDPALDSSSAVYVEVPAGGVSFHHALAVHGSSANTSGHYRHMLCFNYSSADNWPLLGVAGHEFTNHGPVDWERYCSTVVKGKPSVFPRMQALPVCIPIPFEAGYDIYEHSKSSDVNEPEN